MTADEPLPELNDAVLDPDQLSALFRDYRAYASDMEILLRARPGQVTLPLPMEDAPTLDQARELLQSGGVRGVQIRYRYQEASWWDTLMPVSGGVRLVRIKQQ